MKILITGATGLIGQEIVALCQKSSIPVNYLTTSKDKIEMNPDYQGFYWDPYEGVINDACFEGVEVIINLVGASISERWTSSYKKEIIRSRVETTGLLRQRLETIKHTVRHIISASAVGIYPDSKQNYYTEESAEVDPGFLGTVVTKWESAVREFASLDVEVSLLRIGLVLSTKGGAYPKIAKPIRYGVGAAFGSGEQWQSWIHIKDLAQIFLHVAKEELTGVYNAVAPNPVTNEKLTETIAEVLDKKIRIPNIPKFAMKLVMGQMHRIVYDSQRVGSNKIAQAGYRFEFDNLQNAIKDLENVPANS